MSIDLSEKLIQNIQKIGAKYPIEKIILFGSRARGTSRRNSDIDLAIFTLTEFENQGRFSSDIDDLETLLKIDIVFINEKTDLELMENIKKDGAVIYE
ncbi:MAG: nucleotidyltransferase domain-containing protein [Clostridium sp.]|uniref:nucleotidyltransferase domain-containing protein n=1 Tax=Clostridium sp. TaxID=1506 RepID=UPI003D6D2846